MESIAFHVAEDIKLPIKNKSAYRQWILDTAQAEQKSIDFINYIFCSDEYLKDINVKYLNHDYYTDIITFPYREDNVLQSDIYISVDRVAENANDYDVPFEDELRRVMIHGLLHLMGYDDHEDSDIAVIRAKEDFYIGVFPQ
ncbi:MAG: rRNA maturation RNase YbeY [Chitinophagales bacterium]|nr:rRNA maturation RNase YbeY [Chitinophagales bacterium]